MSQITTAEDLRACFRILLGREPHEDEWGWHKWQIGQPLWRVVESFLGSAEFASRRQVERKTGVSIAQCAGWRMYVVADDPFGGRGILETGVYEPHVSAVFRRRLRPGCHVLDIGANIGYYSLLAASVAGPTGSVMAVEPNPRNVRMLLASARLNGFSNIQVIQSAAAREWGVVVLYTDGSQGSVREPGGEAALLDAETVNAARLDDILAGRPVDCIKIDVEGYEYEALSGCVNTIRAHRPLIFSEFQPGSFVGSPEDFLTFLQTEGYALNILREDGPQRVTRTELWREFSACGSDHIDLLLEPHQ